jgi:hypothetical protein
MFPLLATSPKEKRGEIAGDITTVTEIEQLNNNIQD